MSVPLPATCALLLVAPVVVALAFTFALESIFLSPFGRSLLIGFSCGLTSFFGLSFGFSLGFSFGFGFSFSGSLIFCGSGFTVGSSTTSCFSGSGSFCTFSGSGAGSSITMPCTISMEILVDMSPGALLALSLGLFQLHKINPTTMLCTIKEISKPNSERFVCCIIIP